MSGEARGMFAAHIPAGDVGKYASDLPRRLSHAFGDTMTLLQDKVFQDLLMNYPRKERRFIVAYETQDIHARYETIISQHDCKRTILFIERQGR
jgi:hypothetical protein